MPDVGGVQLLDEQLDAQAPGIGGAESRGTSTAILPSLFPASSRNTGQEGTHDLPASVEPTDTIDDPSTMMLDGLVVLSIAPGPDAADMRLLLDQQSRHVRPL